MSTAYSIVVRLVVVCLLALVGLKLWVMWNQKREVDAMFDEMRVLASEASYFQQFDASEADRTLLRLMALMWKAEQEGITPDRVIERIFGIERGIFESTRKQPPEPTRQRLIRLNLESNRDAMRKLGYTQDREIFAVLDDGRLPTVRGGTFAGRQPVIHRVIDPAHSPGLDMVIANFEIRPAPPESPIDDVSLARARQLTRELGSAQVLDHDAIDRITKALSTPGN